MIDVYRSLPEQGNTKRKRGKLVDAGLSTNPASIDSAVVNGIESS